MIAGAGSNATTHAIELARIAEAEGADALLSVVPYYNRPTQAGIAAHFRAIAEETALPIILYDVPSRTARAIDDNTVARLAENPRFAGLKDTTGDLARVLRLRKLVGDDFRLLSGDDATALAFIAQGGNGCISVTSNVVPGLCHTAYLASRCGDIAALRRLSVPIMDVTTALFRETNPVPLKYALSLLGLTSADVRLPLVQLGEQSKKEGCRDDQADFYPLCGGPDPAANGALACRAWVSAGGMRLPRMPALQRWLCGSSIERHSSLTQEQQFRREPAMHADFSSQEYFRDPAAGDRKAADSRPGGRGAVSDRRQGLDHDDAGAGGPSAEGQQDLHAPPGGRKRCRTAMVDAGHRRARLPTACCRWTSRTTARLREIVDEAFRRRAVLEMEPRIRRIARRTGRRAVRGRKPRRSCRPICAKAAALGDLRAARPATRRPAEILRMGGGVHAASPASFGFLAMIPQILAMKRYMEKLIEHVRKEGGEGLIAELVRVETEGGKISRNEMVSMVFLLLFAGHETTTHLISGSVHELLKNPPTARLAGAGLEPRRPGGRGIPALHLAGAIHQAALCATGRRARWRPAEEGRQGHGDAGGRQHGPASERSIRKARSGAKAEPACRLRHRNPLLPWPSARAHRGTCALKALFQRWPKLALAVERIGDQMAQAARHEGDRAAAGRCGRLTKKAPPKRGFSLSDLAAERAHHALEAGMSPFMRPFIVPCRPPWPDCCCCWP